MSHSYYVLKPLSGGSSATSVDMTGTNSKKINHIHGNPAGDSGIVGNTASPMSGIVADGG